ncbi:MAG: hypothetical protein K0U98_01185 [Deltaproteobacteria bacterium]|nr:hypothetical protein [Deltaproteobacteria bacterium]
MGSSTFRRGVGAALLAWAPAALVLSLQYRESVRLRTATGLERLQELEEELLETRGSFELREEAVFALLGEPLELEEVEDETFGEFLHRYQSELRRELEGSLREKSGLVLRRALLGDVDQDDLDWGTLPLPELVEGFLEEIPEEFHDQIIALTDPKVVAYESALGRAPASARALAEALRGSELLGEAEEMEGCLRIVAADGEVLISSFDRLLERHRLAPGVQVQGVASEGDLGDRELFAEGQNCLLTERELADGGRFLFGIPFDREWSEIRRGRFWRNVVLLLGVPLALLIGWGQSRPVHRFLETLRAAARRQQRGETRARLELYTADSDLAAATHTINDTLEHLEESARVLAQMGDSIAHDLRTPLSRLQGQLDLLRRQSGLQGDLLEGVQQEADQIIETFNALLRIAQVETGRKKQEFRPFDLAATVADVAELYAPVFVDKGIAFHFHRPGGEVRVLGDRHLWTQALSNLVENALKYTPAGGAVELTLEPLSPGGRILLRDNGPGIPESERDNVFRRFYRLPDHRGERGNGLGLSLVQAVCDLHEATITLGGSQGLTVEIRL